MGAGASMVMGSAVLLVIAAALGEFGSFELPRPSAGSVLALGYLSVFGSVLAFSAYFWLIGHTTPVKATTHAYVNPVLALLLGWAVAGEPVTSRVLVAAAVIVGGVVTVTTSRPPGPGCSPAADPGTTASLGRSRRRIT